MVLGFRVLYGFRVRVLYGFGFLPQSKEGRVSKIG
jgi:hypothetical protein